MWAKIDCRIFKIMQTSWAQEALLYAFPFASFTFFECAVHGAVRSTGGGGGGVWCGGEDAAITGLASDDVDIIQGETSISWGWTPHL